MDIANEIYSYSKGAVMGKFKHPRRGVQMDRTTEDVATPVPLTIIEHYRDVLVYRYIICEKDTVSLGEIKRHWIYPL